MYYVTINQQFKESFEKQFCEKQECFCFDVINCKLMVKNTAPGGQ